MKNLIKRILRYAFGWLLDESLYSLTQVCDTLNKRVNEIQSVQNRTITYSELTSPFLSKKQIAPNVFLDERIDWNLYTEMQKELVYNFNLQEYKNIACARFRFNHKKYIDNYLPSEKIRRLFITTGSLSLINAFCYIEECGEKNKYEDVVVVFGNQTKQFTENTLAVAKNHNFEKIYFSKHSSDEVFNLIVFSELYNFNEVHFVHHCLVFPVVTDLFISAKLYVLLESPAFFACCEKFASPVQHIYVRNYFEKCDYPYPESNIPIKYMQKNSLERELRIIRRELDLNIKLPSEGKWILFCGPSIGILNSMKGREKTVLKYLKVLQDYGYKILFKNHPRLDKDIYGEVDFDFLATSYSLEFYDLSNFVAVVGFVTGALLTFQDFGLPVFSIVPDGEMLDFSTLSDYWANWQLERAVYYIKNYIMSYEELLNVDISKSAEDIKEELIKKQECFLNTKPKMSENEEYKQRFPFENELNYSLTL